MPLGKTRTKSPTTQDKQYCYKPLETYYMYNVSWFRGGQHSTLYMTYMYTIRPYCEQETVAAAVWGIGGLEFTRSRVTKECA